MAFPADTTSSHEDIAPPPSKWLDFDVYLVLIVAALLAIGLMMVYSTTFDWSYLEYGSPIRIFLNQVRSFVIGLVALIIAWRMDYRILRNRWVATGIMVVAIVALGVLLVLNNRSVLGAQRSLYQGSFQPGEAAKLAVIIYFGAWLASRREQLQYIGYGLIPFILLVGLVGGLIVLQPDLSTAAIIVLTAGTMFFVAGANIIQIGLIAVGAVFVGWTLSTQFSYARERLIAHINAMQDLTQASWHVQQAVIAFTAPGSRPGSPFSPNWFGVGLGQSRQSLASACRPHRRHLCHHWRGTRAVRLSGRDHAVCVVCVAGLQDRGRVARPVRLDSGGRHCLVDCLRGDPQHCRYDGGTALHRCTASVHQLRRV